MLDLYNSTSCTVGECQLSDTKPKCHAEKPDNQYAELKFIKMYKKKELQWLYILSFYSSFSSEIQQGFFPPGFYL